MKICFIAAGPIQWASSRYRAYWVADALEEMGHSAEVVYSAQQPPESDVYIWQKVASLDFIRATPHARHYWDLCDPSWWWQPKECQEIARHMTGFVFSTAALMDDFKAIYPLTKNHHYIADRFDLSHYHTYRRHTHVSPVRFIWYGIAANRVALIGAKAALERLAANEFKIELTIFDDRPDVPYKLSEDFPIYHTQWTYESEIDVIASHDIALLPPYPGAWGKVKSDNKAKHAKLCGLPVVTGNNYQHLQSTVLAGPGRFKTIPSGKDYDVKQSAAEWLKVLQV